MIARSLTIRGPATFGSLLLAAVFVIGLFVDACFAQMPMGQSQLSEMTDMLIGDWRTPLTRIVFQPGGEFTSYVRNKVYRGTFRLLDNRHVQMTFESGVVRVHFIRVLSATQWRHNLVGTESIIDHVRFETQEALSRWGDRQYVDGQASGKVPTASTSQGGTPKANSNAASTQTVNCEQFQRLRGMTTKDVVDRANTADTFGRYAEALCWFLKADAEGHAGSAFWIGVYYSEGRAVRKDEAKAFEWYLRAAQRGHSSAMELVASALQHGLGVKADPALAKRWEDAAKVAKAREDREAAAERAEFDREIARLDREIAANRRRRERCHEIELSRSVGNRPYEDQVWFAGNCR